jgi:DNA replication protein DnaC
LHVTPHLAACWLGAAGFRDQKTIEDFDWDFNPSIKKKQIFDLLAVDFLRNHLEVLLVGPPGVGKSHIAQSLGLALIKAGYTVFYRSIFDAVWDLLHDEASTGTSAPCENI